MFLSVRRTERETGSGVVNNDIIICNKRAILLYSFDIDATEGYKYASYLSDVFVSFVIS